MKKCKSKKENIIKSIGFWIAIMLILLSIYMIAKYAMYGKLTHIKTSDLDGMDLSKYNKVMIVAHPDDELIFGGANLINDDYLVICITNKNNETRKKEFEKLMEATGDKGIMLSYPDKIFNSFRSHWILCCNDIEKDLSVVLKYKDWDTIVTHNATGEYGHIHHKMTHRIVDGICDELGKSGKQKYFAKYYKNSQMNGVDKSKYISDELVKQKEELSKIYESQSKTIKKLQHIFPYEAWQKR